MLCNISLSLSFPFRKPATTTTTAIVVNSFPTWTQTWIPRVKKRIDRSSHHYSIGHSIFLTSLLIPFSIQFQRTMWIISRIVSSHHDGSYLFYHAHWYILSQFGESRWTRAIFITIVVQAVLAIIFEAVIFSYHATQISIIDRERLDQKGYGLELTAAYANARSLLVYFILFMVAQVFTVGLVVDAVRESRKECVERSMPVPGDQLTRMYVIYRSTKKIPSNWLPWYALRLAWAHIPSFNIISLRLSLTAVIKTCNWSSLFLVTIIMLQNGLKLQWYASWL